MKRMNGQLTCLYWLGMCVGENWRRLESGDLFFWSRYDQSQREDLADGD